MAEIETRCLRCGSNVAPHDESVHILKPPPVEEVGLGDEFDLERGPHREPRRHDGLNRPWP